MMCVFVRLVTFFMFNFAQDDPVIGYEDEFGRIRTAPRSEVPRNLKPVSEDDVDEDE